ncbi:MAG TPA: carboxypeptidase-like regulatory domain-containing protein, partial [Planctomycetota bacterium]|nr:carboxypeptidase-like regulatory domain-containing protein [Planctomycetota bacterium]
PAAWGPWSDVEWMLRPRDEDGGKDATFVREANWTMLRRSTTLDFGPVAAGPWTLTADTIGVALDVDLPRDADRNWTLPEPRDATVRCVDAAGAPMKRFTVRVRVAKPDDEFRPWVRAVRGADGVARLKLPNHAVVLEVDAPRCGKRATILPRGVAETEITLSAPCELVVVQPEVARVYLTPTGAAELWRENVSVEKSPGEGGADGEPRAGFNMAAASKLSMLLGHYSQKDGDDRRFNGLAAGDYELILFRAPDYEPEVRRVTLTPGAPQRVDLTEPAKGADVPVKRRVDLVVVTPTLRPFGLFVMPAGRSTDGHVPTPTPSNPHEDEAVDSEFLSMLEEFNRTEAVARRSALEPSRVEGERQEFARVRPGAYEVVLFQRVGARLVREVPKIDVAPGTPAVVDFRIPEATESRPTGAESR